MSAGTKWIVAIVGLLVANLVAMGVLIGASRSGQSRVIPAYYDKAVHYNDAIDQAAKNRELGWRISLRSEAGTFKADVVDRAGAPLANARVEIASVARVSGQQRGLYDVTVTVSRGPDRFVETTVAETR